MLPKFGLILYFLLPFAMFGQAVVTPNYQMAESAPFGRIYNPENSLFGPLDHKEFFGQLIYREPLSLISVIRPGDNKTGVSRAGGLIFAGTDDVFAYAHYGRTGKLIWRTSPIANNMMATRWSLANLPIFQRTAFSRFPVN